MHTYIYIYTFTIFNMPYATHHYLHPPIHPSTRLRMPVSDAFTDPSLERSDTIIFSPSWKKNGGPKNPLIFLNFGEVFQKKSWVEPRLSFIFFWKKEKQIQLCDHSSICVRKISKKAKSLGHVLLNSIIEVELYLERPEISKKYMTW